MAFLELFNIPISENGGDGPCQLFPPAALRIPICVSNESKRNLIASIQITHLTVDQYQSVVYIMRRRLLYGIDNN